jgi:hypothetical protein
MGYGEYGGGGSVHWKTEHGKGRDANAKADKSGCDGIDDHPNAGGDFTVEVYGVAANSWTYQNGTLTVRVPIRHGPPPKRQVRVSWPDPTGPGV